MQLEEVRATDRDAVLKRLARAAVVEDGLAIGRETCRLDRAEDVVVARAVKDWRRDMEAGDIRFRHAVLVKVVARIAQTLLDGRVAVFDLLADDFDSHAEMRLENLSDVHTGRDTQRIQNDVDRRAIRKERHVFLAHDA